MEEKILTANYNKKDAIFTANFWIFITKRGRLM